MKKSLKIRIKGKKRNLIKILLGLFSLPFADTFPVVGGLASDRESESYAGKGSTKPKRLRMSRQTKSAQRSSSLGGFCIGPTTLSCIKSASYRNRNKKTRI